MAQLYNGIFKQPLEKRTRKLYIYYYKTISKILSTKSKTYNTVYNILVTVVF